MLSTQAAFAEYQGLLLPIARKMLGNPQDAEDMVQETLLKWLSKQPKGIENPKGYLVRTLINKCLNFIRDHQKESPHEISPELLVDLPPARLDHEHLVSASFRMLFEKLNPVERAVFLLKEVFHYSHREMAELLDIKEDHCRQLLSRAKRRLKDGKVRFEVEEDQHESLYQTFVEVCQGEDLELLLELLQEDVALYRGHAPAPAAPDAMEAVLTVSLPARLHTPPPSMGQPDQLRDLLSNQLRLLSCPHTTADELPMPSRYAPRITRLNTRQRPCTWYEWDEDAEQLAIPA